MKKPLLLGILSTSLCGLIISCGGGGGGGSSNSTTSESNAVRGGVSASIVANATVCLEDSEGNILVDNNGLDICNQTNDNGTFQLKVPPDVDLTTIQIGLYAKDRNGNKIKIGEAAYTTIKKITQELDPNATDVIDINPLSLADGNQTFADDLGAAMHALGGDINGTAQKIDFGNVDIEQITDFNGDPIYLEKESLENLIKQEHRLKIIVRHNGRENMEIEIMPDNATTPVLCKIDKDGDDEYEEEIKVKYSLDKHEKEWKEHLQEIEKEYHHPHFEEIEQLENNTMIHNNTLNHIEEAEEQGMENNHQTANQEQTPTEEAEEQGMENNHQTANQEQTSTNMQHNQGEENH